MGLSICGLRGRVKTDKGSLALFSMVGRGTRLFPGKTHLLLLDFLWHTEKHELCRPAHLISENEEVAKAMVERTEENTGAEFELLELEEVAKEDVTAQREEALAKTTR